MPEGLTDWLEPGQLAAVRFAYEYDRAEIAPVLGLQAQPTRVQAEIVAALAVHPANAPHAGQA